MCNCGKKRTELKQHAGVISRTSVQPIQQATQNKTGVVFQYTGKTALTVTGSNTRKTYRFNFPGDIQTVETSDANGMNSIVVLKRMWLFCCCSLRDISRVIIYHPARTCIPFTPICII